MTEYLTGLELFQISLNSVLLFGNSTFDLNPTKVHQKLPGASLQVKKKYNFAVSIGKSILPLMIMD